MGDRLTYCDVMETCEECPRYGKDCDGDKRDDDLISRTDAIEAVCNNCTSEKYCDRSCQNICVIPVALNALPSAEAKPTVIRCKTLLPTKDFKEWAKRIREENPNAVIIPCDAEVVSSEATCATCADRAMCIMSAPDGKWKACKDYRAEAVQGWIPIKYHEITEIERKENGYPKDWVYFLDCEMPNDEQEILVQAKNGEIRWDVCYEDDGFSLDSGWDWKDDIIAWMPLPDPYKGGEDE